MNNIPVIIAIVGESGTGKTCFAEKMDEYFGINLLESYTDRPKRTEDEKGHTFVSKEEFDGLDEEDFVAYTKYGEYRYACLNSQLKRINSYVIDEQSLVSIKDKHKQYKVVSIKITRDLNKRKLNVDYKRIERDLGRFILPNNYYDYHIINNSDNIVDLYNACVDICNHILSKRIYNLTEDL